MWPALAAVVSARGHGAVTFPPPRNAVDRKLSPWKGAVPLPTPFDGWCPITEYGVKGGLSGANGQACFWFSNGCSWACERCDGDTRGPVPNFVYVGNGTVPSWGSEGIVLNPDYKQPVPTPNCARPKRNATICDPKLRTVNTAAACGTKDDIYYFSPGNGCCGAEFVNSSSARLADHGSSLPKRPTGTVWKAGTNIEVGWTIMAFHGGGYHYRLCPASEPLTEECFQRTPLTPVGKSALRWDGNRSGQLEFEATRVSVGTVPPGSTWTKNPIPRGPWGWQRSGPAFQPVCNESDECQSMHMASPPHGAYPDQTPCRCSGEGALPFNLEVVDTLVLPADLAPGEWVLGFRWDCEESFQIWASCSDVTIV